MEHINITPGLALRHIPTTKFNTCCVVALLRQPLRHDEATKNALLPRVLRMGCGRHKTLQNVNRALEEMNGAVFECGAIKKGEEQIIQLFLETPEHGGCVERALGFLRAMLLEPLNENNAFPEEHTRRAKEQLAEAIAARRNDKAEYARLRCIEEMCSSEAFGVSGDGYAEDIDEITAGELFAHYERVLRTSRCGIMIIGGGGGASLAEQVERLFAAGLGTEAQAMPGTAYKYQAGGTREVREQMDIGQAKLCMGMRACVPPDSDDYYHLLAANEVFGGGAESRLFVNVREKAGLCYGIGSQLLRFKSLLLVQAGVDPGEAERAVKLIQEQAAGVAAGIGKDEFEKARWGLVNRFRRMGDDPARTLDFYLGQELAGDETGFEEAIRRIEGAGARRAAEVFRRVWTDTVYLLSPTVRGEEARV